MGNFIFDIIENTTRKNNEEDNINLKSIIFVTIAVIVIVSLFAKKDTWKGFYYPDAGNLTYDIESPVYESLEECRSWVNQQVAKYNPSGSGYDYECGKNCKLKEELSVLVCEETVH